MDHVVPGGRKYKLGAMIGFFMALMIVVGVSAFQHYKKAIKLVPLPPPDSHIVTQTKTAFLRWRTQILGEETPGRGRIPGLITGEDVYVAYNYPNPPIMPLLLWPLAVLPATLGAMLFFILKVGLGVCIVIWSMRLCRHAYGQALPIWSWITVTILSLHPLLGDLSHGNVNIVIAFFVTAALELYRRDRFGWAGLALSLAIAAKITPALFLGYFAWKACIQLYDRFQARTSTPLTGRNGGGPPRLLCTCMLGLILWWFIVPGAILGWNHNLKLMNSWYEGMVRPFLVEGKITSEHANQSLPGTITRLFTNSASAIEYDEDNRPYMARQDNLADIGPANAKFVTRLFQAMWVGAVVLLCWHRSRWGLGAAAEMSMVMLGMLLFSERTWKHHAVVLVLPFAVIIEYMRQHVLINPKGVSSHNYEERGSPVVFARSIVTRNLLFMLCCIVSMLLIWIPSIIGGQFQDASLTYGTHTIAFVMLLVAMCMILIKHPPTSVWSDT